MNKLKQLKLKSAVILLEKEMKAVYGGSGSGSGDSCRGGGCTAIGSGSSAICIPTSIWGCYLGTTPNGRILCGGCAFIPVRWPDIDPEGSGYTIREICTCNG